MSWASFDIKSQLLQEISNKMCFCISTQTHYGVIILNLSLIICCCNGWRERERGEENIQIFEYLENVKSFLNEINKSIFHIFKDFLLVTVNTKNIADIIFNKRSRSPLELALGQTYQILNEQDIKKIQKRKITWCILLRIPIG